MPIPRYQPVKKRIKLKEFSLDNLDDVCLSKIIGFALALSSNRDDQSAVVDTGRVERNLSLVSKRWYFMAQIQACTFGVHRINLDSIPRAIEQLNRVQPARLMGAPSTAYKMSNLKKPGVLVQRNTGANMTIAHSATPFKTPRPPPLIPNFSLHLFHYIQPRLLKYKHINIEGTLQGEDFKKLIISIDSARVEKLSLKIKISRDGSQTKDLICLPQNLGNLKRLVLHWSSDSSSSYSNALTWSVFCRANNLEEFEIHLSDNITEDDEVDNSVIFDKFENLYQTHPNLRRLVFNRSSDDHSPDCPYTSIMKYALDSEKFLTHFHTSDSVIVEHLIKCSDRLCTAHDLRSLKFTNPIRNVSLATRLLGSRRLGVDSLSIMMNNLDKFDEIRQSAENFKLLRHEKSVFYMNLNLKDKKFPDSEERIKNIVLLSRLADVTIHVSAQQRVSIDCCHLMWSVGRGLNISGGKCLFKIFVQDGPTTKTKGGTCSEITIPFGGYKDYRINSKREDPLRHREIIKSLRKDCYHQFVKGVRESLLL